MEQKIAFQVNRKDNVATALTELSPGNVMLSGSFRTESISALERIPPGHKLAICDICDGDDIIKYGVPIGRAVRDIARGSWVHLHNMASKVDERSSHLDIHTGAPTDIAYE